MRSSLGKLTPVQIRQAVSNVDVKTAEILLSDWELWARPEQLEPQGNWQYWLILAGRGWGKTRTGAEWVKEQVRKYPLVNLIGATADDARDVMIEGESGILAVCNRWERPRYIQNKNRLEWPNGSRSLIFSAEKPERLRGKQHMCIWADELAAWRYSDAWDQAMMGLRLGDNPRAIITTTPKPTAMVKELAKDSLTYVTRGTTFDNKANLAKNFLSKILKKYEGTRLGRQELNAEILEDNPNALWNRKQIDLLRVKRAPILKRIVVAVDPNVSSSETADECGIIVAGICFDNHGYVIGDYSLLAGPNQWAHEVVKAYKENKADRVIGEVNNGGELIEINIRTVDKNISYKAVRASRGKAIRAEPVSSLYEQGKVHHVGFFAKLEDEMCDFDPVNPPAVSPNRMDALVWAITELMLEDNDTAIIDYYADLLKPKKPKKIQ